MGSSGTVNKEAGKIEGEPSPYKGTAATLLSTLSVSISTQTTGKHHCINNSPSIEGIQYIYIYVNGSSMGYGR